MTVKVRNINKPARSRWRLLKPLALLLALGLVAAACGSDSDPVASDDTPAESTDSADSTEAPSESSDDTEPPAEADGEPITIGSIYDLTGGLNIYGIQQNQALDLAVASLNENGGVLGRPVEVAGADAQSEDTRYVQFANTLIQRDGIVALFAGLTSSSREAMRPIVRENEIPYFYTSLYEGGACDRQTFVTGSSASQQMSVLIEWAIEEYGPKMYLMAPDYNFGTISGHWVEFYADEFGGEVVGQDFIPLSVTDYQPLINSIQAADPDFVVTLPVGANQTGFLEQFSAAGLKDEMGIVSTNYGSGNQQIVVSAEAGEGIVASQEYFQVVGSSANPDFIARWTEAYGNDEPIISEAANTWNAVHLWAAAVEIAGTTDNEAVLDALESGISFEGPGGTVTLNPGSHHLTQNIYIVQGNDSQGFEVVETFEAAAPTFEDQTCDLVANPELVDSFDPLN